MILTYWQQGYWQAQQNRFCIPSNCFSSLFPAHKSKTVSHFPWLATVPFKGLVWIAPLIYQAPKKDGYLVPLWLPGEILDGRLRLSQQHLPWIPACLFGAIFSRPLECFDEWLGFECIDNEGTYLFQDWNALYEATLSLLDNLSEGGWEQQLRIMGYTLSDTVGVVEGAQLAIVSPPFSPLLLQYASIEEQVPKLQWDEDTLIEKMPIVFPYRDENTLSWESIKACVHALCLQEGELLAIKTSVSSEKYTFLKTLLYSIWAGNMKEGKVSQSICIYTPHPEQIHTVFSQLPTSTSQALTAHGIALANTFFKLQTEIEQEDIVKKIQKKDAKAEKLLTILDQYQKAEQAQQANHTLLKKGLTVLFSSKKTRQERARKVKVWSERVRALKVRRAKLNRELIEAVEQLTVSRRARQAWHAWLQENNLDYLKDSQDRRECMHAILMLGSVYSVETVPKTKQSSSTQHLYRVEQGRLEAIESITAPIDLMIIDEANRLLPQEVIPWLNHARSALFLGNVLDLQPCRPTGSFQEHWDLRIHGLHEEETVEQLCCKQMLIASGNAFTVALSNSSYKEKQDFDIFCATLALPAYSVETFEFIDIAGESEVRGQEYVNKLEAEKVVHWLQTGALRHAHPACVVVTPFQAQKRLILQLLEKADVLCPVHTFEDFPFLQWEQVVFSPVYTVKNARPYLFDQGEHFLHSVMMRAKKCFWVIGDKRIFNVTTHSPSGWLAKRLFAHVKNGCNASVD